MGRNEYVAERARQLAECLSDGEANGLIEQIEADIHQGNLTADEQRDLWREIRRKYEEAPKPFLRETISGRKLNQLQAAVQQFLQGKSAS